MDDNNNNNKNKNKLLALGLLGLLVVGIILGYVIGNGSKNNADENEKTATVENVKDDKSVTVNIDKNTDNTEVTEKTDSDISTGSDEDGIGTENAETENTETDNTETDNTINLENSDSDDGNSDESDIIDNSDEKDIEDKGEDSISEAGNSNKSDDKNINDIKDKESKDSRDNKGNRENKEDKGNRENKEDKENREDRENKEDKENKENKEDKENREDRANKEDSENIDNRENTEDRESREIKGNDGEEDKKSGQNVKENKKDNTENKDIKSGETEKENGENGVSQENKESSEDYTLTYSSDNSWQNGNVTMYGMQFGATNGTADTVGGWKIIMTVEGLNNVEGWNGSFSISGDKMTVVNADYNGDIYAGGTVTFGCNLGVTASSLRITSATINGHEMKISAGRVDQNNQNNNVNNGNSGNNGNGGNGGNNGNGGNTGNTTGDVEVTKLLKRGEAAVQGDDWLHTDGRKILDKNGKEVWLTGVNWFGYNTGTNTFDGLWNSQLEPTVKSIADHGFNLIRVPISAELINQWANGEYPRANYNNAYNTALNNMNSLEIWDYFLELARASGLKVMPDIHSAETNASGHNVNLWCTSKVTVKDYYHALEWMAERYKNNDTIIAYDLKNEPHGKPYEGSAAAIWNDSKEANNWKYVAETAAAKILAKNPNVLIMVEGTEIYPIDLKTNSDYHSTNDKDYYFNWWGGNLRAVKDYPVSLGKYQNKLVYSPHDYGPTVYEQPWFKGKYDYDSLMKDCWHDNWFYIYEDNTAPLLIGEWGGFMTEPNLTWMTYMRKLIKKYRLNHTFWCLNANSGDTGGLLLDDFKTWDQTKYDFVKEVLWQENGKFVGLDHAIALGDNGISIGKLK